MGLLCIASNAEGLSENVIDKRTGWIVRKRDPLMITDKIVEVLNLPEYELNLIRENAVKHVRNKYNLEKQKRQFLQFYS